MSENEKKLISRSRSRPSLELYKPPVLRGKSFISKNVNQNLQVESEKNIQKEISPKQDVQSSNKFLNKSIEILLEEEQKQMNSSFKKLEKNENTSFQMNFDDLINNLFLKEKQDGNEIGNFIVLNCSSPQLAKYIGIFIIKYLIEDWSKNNKKNLKKGILSKIFNSLTNTSLINSFYNGAVLSLERYFECKDYLRGEIEINEENKEKYFYFLIWQNFILITFELAQISNEERVINLVFNIFNYLFNIPILNNLKISELELILSFLLIYGNNLELDYPIKIDEFNCLLRNASLNCKESWARKLILLMIELSAVNWKIVPQIEEYYYLNNF